MRKIGRLEFVPESRAVGTGCASTCAITSANSRIQNVIITVTILAY